MDIAVMEAWHKAVGYVSRTWWMSIIEGIVATGAALVLFFDYAATIMTLFQVLGVYWFVAGALNASAALFESPVPGRGARLTGGVVLALMGASVLVYQLTGALLDAIVLDLVFASLSLLAGALILGGGIALSSVPPRDYWAIASGSLCVLLGIVLLGAPFLSIEAMLMLSGVFAFVGGVAEIVSGVRSGMLKKRLAGRNRLVERLSRRAL